MPDINWSSDFSVGIADFDQHHQQLIALINQTNGLLEGSCDAAELDRVIASLIEYAGYHFSAEEAWMAEQGYPERAAHLAQHRSFTAQILQLRDKVAADRAATAEELSAYLYFWLVDHILINDLPYAQFAGTRAAAPLLT